MKYNKINQSKNKTNEQKMEFIMSENGTEWKFTKSQKGIKEKLNRISIHKHFVFIYSTYDMRVYSNGKKYCYAAK